MKNKILIPNNEIEFKMLTRDDVGRVFWWNGRVFRAINKNKESHVNRLLSSGLIEKLVEEKMFPETWVSDYRLDDYDLILEHKKIDRVIYPYEWSFEMLRDAAILVLKLNKMAEKFGYQTKDSHGYNVLFDNTTPKFVDFGSFIEKKKGDKVWRNRRGFLENYYFSLKMWAKGNQKIIQSVSANAINLDTTEYLIFNNCIGVKLFIKLFGIDRLRKAVNIFWKLKKVGSVDSEKIKEKVFSPLGSILVFLKEKDLIPFQRTNFDKEIKRIRGIKKRVDTSQWGTYNWRHEKYPRFNDILKIINTITDAKSFIDLAGNNGAFSKFVLKETNIKKVICSDYDNNAIDLAHKTFRDNKIAVTSLVLNFMNPAIKRYHVLPNNRLKSDIVSALAVTHHLIFTQKLPLDYIFKTIKSYSNKYVLIEFKPLGLYSKKSKDEFIIPSWYNEEWFRGIFEKHFKLKIRKQIGKNRIMFLGEVI